MTAHPLAAARTPAESALAEQFSAGQGALPLPEREAAFRAFSAKGLPTRRDEAWHYTDLRQRLTKIAPPADAPDDAAVRKARARVSSLVADVTHFVILDGRLVANLGSPPSEGVSIVSLGEDARAGRAAAPDLGANVDAVLALNGALAQGGAVIRIAPHAKLSAPIEIRHWGSERDARSIASRVAVEIGAGAKATIVEYFEGKAGDQRNAATILDIGADAKVEHVAVVEGEAALHLESLVAKLSQGASLSAFGFISGGELVRRQIFATLVGENAKLALNGLSLLGGRRHADTTLLVDHVAPHGESREFFKHVVADEATGVYQGKVVVEPGAQKTDGGMKSQAILLSPAAVMNNKPELEIFADDVVCGHGATVGALDREQLFYLRARGIPEAEAEAMLLEAFGFEAIERVGDEAMREILRGKARKWLADRAEAKP